MQVPDNVVAIDRWALLQRLQEISEMLPSYLGARPNGEMAQDAFDWEFDRLMDEEETILRLLGKWR